MMLPLVPDLTIPTDITAGLFTILILLYVEKVGPWLKENGGEVFAKDTDPRGKEKTEDSNLAVICEFPSMRIAVDAYESSEYQELSKLRKAATVNATFTIMEGMDEATKLRRAMGM